MQLKREKEESSYRFQRVPFKMDLEKPEEASERMSLQGEGDGDEVNIQ